ncbi:DNA alkylation repair protein [Hymenobacter sp. B81]|uniref:DNA alkylation repair protein n=1 Tax=Hymenobacter sp. B81 TaxID=3344878 RepID=UPI0037DC7AE0
MSFDEIYQQLQTLGTEQTRQTYRRHGCGDHVFGVSFAELGKLKKQLVGRGKDRAHAHALARQLWPTGNFEARTLATMLADPQQLSAAEAEAWAAEVPNHALADSLAALVAETPFAQAKLAEWTATPDEYRQRLGFALLGRLALQDAALPDAFFEPYIRQIEQQLAGAANRAREGMNNCLISIGSRNEALRQRVEAAADRIGPVSIDHGDTACQTFDVRPYLAKVWARKAARASA